MVLTFLGSLVSAVCVFASLRRLIATARATALDPEELASALRATRSGDGSRFWSALRAEIVVQPQAEWERDLLGALGAPLATRAALVNEQLGELDYRAQEWGRAPRVCASISSSFGFLLASVVVCSALASEDVDVNAAVLSAINVVAVGLAGAALCIAVHVRAGAMVRGRLVATDKLLERMEGIERTLERAGADERTKSHPQLPAPSSLV